MKKITLTVLAVLAWMPAQSEAYNMFCNTRLDTSARKFNWLRHTTADALHHLAGQGVKQFEEWGCQDWEGPEKCAAYGRNPAKIMILDDHGRVLKTRENSTTPTTWSEDAYSYEGDTKYPVSVHSTSSFGTDRVERLSPVDAHGVRLSSPEWRSTGNGVVRLYSEDGLFSARYVDGRYQSGTALIGHLDGLTPIVIGGPQPDPMDSLYEVECTIRQERDGGVFVEGRYTPVKGGPTRSEAWRYSARGDVTWSRLADGGEFRYVPTEIDAKGNWLKRRVERPDGTAMLEFRRVEYHD
ncbi:hypothetical protein [Luteimonas sp. e5]